MGHTSGETGIAGTSSSNADRSRSLACVVFTRHSRNVKEKKPSALTFGYGDGHEGDKRWRLQTATSAALLLVSSSQLMFEQLPSQDEWLKSLVAAAQRDARDGCVALRIGRRGGRSGQQSQCRIEQVELTLLQSVQEAVAQNLNSDGIATRRKARARQSNAWTIRQAR